MNGKTKIPANELATAIGYGILELVESNKDIRDLILEELPGVLSDLDEELNWNKLQDDVNYMRCIDLDMLIKRLNMLKDYCESINESH